MDNFLKQKKIIIIVLLFSVVVIYILFMIGRTKNEEAFKINSDVKQVQSNTQIKELEEKIKNDSENAYLKRELSRAYYSSGNLDDAEKYIKIAIQADEKFPQYYVDLGRIYEEGGDFIKAEEVYKKAIELNTKEFQNPMDKIFPTIIENGSGTPPFMKEFSPVVYNLPTPYTALAEFYVKQKRELEGIKILEEGIKVLPKYPDFYKLLSDIYMEMGNEERADLYKAQFDTLIKNQ